MSARTCPDWPELMELDPDLHFKHYTVAVAQLAAEALSRFDALKGVEPEEMPGRWRGTGLATGHPLDGLLEKLGWHGKAFGTDDVQPLLFRARPGRIVALDPALMPVGVALRWPRLARSAPVCAAFYVVRPFLRARRPSARLRKVWFRGRLGAAMIYDRQPIIDHFRRIDRRRVLGLLEMRGDVPPYFFLLCRAEGGGDAPLRRQSRRRPGYRPPACRRRPVRAPAPAPMPR